MGDRKETQHQTQTRDPYNPAKPAIDQSIKGVQKWLSDPASSQAYQGGMSGWTQQGLTNLGNSAGAIQSRDYLSNVLSGKYLDAGNPHQSALDASIRSAVMPSINSTFSNAGMAGSTMHQGMLMKGLTEGLAAPRYQTYNNERSAQGQAAGLLPQVDGQISQNQLTAGQTQEAYDRAQWEENRIAKLRPHLEAQGLLGQYGNMGGTSTGTTTTTSKTPVGEQILGAGMIGAQMFAGMPPGIGGIRTNVGGSGWGYAPQGSLPWQENYHPLLGYMSGN